MREASILALAVSSWLLPACTPSAPVHPNAFDRRASFDLNCPWQNLDFTPISEQPAVYGVTGCGKRATYVRRCETKIFQGTDFGGPCSWSIDGVIQPDGAAASAPAPKPASSSPPPATPQ